jgi:hypothetical protein
VATRILLVLALLALSSDQIKSPAPLTEVEQLRVQNLNLERVIIERQMQDWTVKQQKLKADIELARPGYTWDPTTGQFATKPEPPK